MASEVSRAIRWASPDLGIPLCGEVRHYRFPLGPSLISYRDETDKSDNIIIGPKLIEPVMIELIAQPYGEPRRAWRRR